MAIFKISTIPASKSYTDGIPFISMVFGYNNELNSRTFEAKKLSEVVSEVKHQESLATISSVTIVEKIQGRAPSGYNEWYKRIKFYDPLENKQC